MARIRLIRGSSAPTRRNLRKLMPEILTYMNTVAIVALLLHVFLD